MNKEITKEEAIEIHKTALLEAAKPLIKFLNDNHHPHITVTVDCIRARMVEDLITVKTEEYFYE